MDPRTRMFRRLPRSELCCWNSCCLLRNDCTVDNVLALVTEWNDFSDPCECVCDSGCCS